MRRAAFGAGLVVLITAVPNGAVEQDAVARLRTALGGETALGNVQTIRARGTIANKPLKNHFDIAFALPARFVKITRSFSRTDASWVTDWAHVPGTWPQRMEPVLIEGDISSYEQAVGFDGPTLIPERSRAYWGANPAQAAVALDRAHARLAEFVLPLLAATPSLYPVEAVSVGNAIVFRAAGEREWRLELDPATDLPARLLWSYPLPPDAPASRTRTQTVTEFSDFRFAGTLRWPHRLITSIDGKRVEDATVTRYDVNTKLPDKLFRK